MNKETLFKLILSTIAGGIGGWLAFRFSDLPAFSFLIGWDGFALTYLISSWLVFARIPQEKIAERCAAEDAGSWVLFLMVVVVGSVSLGTVVSFFQARILWDIPQWIVSLAGIMAIAFSWAVVHTSFAFRYAHLYYGDEKGRFSRHTKGLVFPGSEQPDYFDFVYFSFVIGMTFQVSDVVITAKGVRRLALLHSLVSFVFNTVIIAATISELMSLN